MSNDFRYEIKQRIAVLGQYQDETKEVNYISYNGREPKVDIRKWTAQPDGSKRMGKGITLSLKETQALYEALKASLEGLPQIQ